MARRALAAVAEPQGDDMTQLELPGFEGHTVERLAVAWSGTIRLKPTNAAHVALMSELTLGRSVPFTIGGVEFTATVRQRVAKQLGASSMLSTSKLDVDLAGGEDASDEPDEPEDDDFQ